VLAEFVAMSEVRKLIEQAVEPFQIVPRMQIELKTHSNMLRDMSVQQKLVMREIDSIKDSLREFTQVDKSIKKLEMDF
jgi:tRNA isopentenyl-2-thiomethyl-A-37 hydroxylase MiaE